MITEHQHQQQHQAFHFPLGPRSTPRRSRSTLYNFNILISAMPKSNNNENISSQRQCATNTIDTAFRARPVEPAAVAAILHKILMKFLCDDDIFVILDFFTRSRSHSLWRSPSFARFSGAVKHISREKGLLKLSSRYRVQLQNVSKYQRNMTIDGNNGCAWINSQPISIWILHSVWTQRCGNVYSSLRNCRQFRVEKTRFDE